MRGRSTKEAQGRRRGDAHLAREQERLGEAQRRGRAGREGYVQVGARAQVDARALGRHDGGVVERCDAGDAHGEPI